MLSMQRWFVGLVMLAMMGAFAFLMPLRALAADDSIGDLVPQNLRDAIREHVEGQDLDYAGLCREIVQSEHHGETCAFVFFQDDGRALVTYGAVASDQIDQQYFTNEGGRWVAEGSTSDPEPEAGDVPEGLRDAIRDFLEQRGLTYAGLCTEIVPWEHYGETCAAVAWLHGGKAQVTYGAVASDELTNETFFEDETGWHATSSGPIVPPDYDPETPTATPSEPGTPTDPNDDSTGHNNDRTALLTLGAIAFGIVAVGGIGAGTLKRRR